MTHNYYKMHWMVQRPWLQCRRRSSGFTNKSVVWQNTRSCVWFREGREGLTWRTLGRNHSVGDGKGLQIDARRLDVEDKEPRSRSPSYGDELASLSWTCLCSRQGRWRRQGHLSRTPRNSDNKRLKAELQRKVLI